MMMVVAEMEMVVVVCRIVSKIQVVVAVVLMEAVLSETVIYAEIISFSLMPKSCN